MTTIGDALRAAVPGVPVQADAPLAPFTTFKVGGPADWLVEPASGDDLVRVVQRVLQLGLPLTMLGGGSNVLIADAGIRGVVVRPRGGTLQLVG
ncbi:MAG: FAD-binding protein, partial [Acidobacteria bacterium]|nr:FAD-binding protein [Acidobacteriota bacterium]